jgi:hypothetical protein
MAGAITLAAVVALMIWAYRSNPILTLLEEYLAPFDLRLYSRLEDWERHFGPAATIEQEDGIHSFFYWPDRGLGVFCHPHFRAQNLVRASRDWQVTSIFIPLRHSIEVAMLPTKPGTRIEFSRLAQISFGSRPLSEVSYADIRKLFLFRFRQGQCEETLSNNLFWPFARSVANLHFSDGDLVMIELRSEDLLFTYYD